jgi:hypothetical protein
VAKISHACSNVARRGQRYGKKSGFTKTEKRFQELQNYFQFNSCMIRGCNYGKTFDIHRYISGKDGGKYEIGNMFAICPNHHAEIHRGVIQIVKINNCELEITEANRLDEDTVLKAAGGKTFVSSSLTASAEYER